MIGFSIHGGERCRGQRALSITEDLGLSLAGRRAAIGFVAEGEGSVYFL